MRVLLHTASSVLHGVSREFSCKPFIFIKLQETGKGYSIGNLIA